ncbi:class IV adenylate cyclase [Borrelia hermsii]|uniref:Adenylate cyclase n=3 Tax=Borrelia hermsii TaxID=140 RepID=A0AAN0X4Y1_BORHE|nr:class IV adenylate cyclase [Borrelia hermsii]AAX17221.1 adenylate cyclase [Borrelia hermsii DAH]AJW73504.1 adenylyl cyclase [Borrelia hermsii CC1]AMR75143.1 Adenylate cyclase [Borrelia hermsii]ANA43520.1 adenylyl cyclase [Borrelia hermsii HS1]UCP01716.1 class IV adenylate cyclase [Borrelia hermsii]
MFEIELKAFIPKNKLKKILKLANQKFKFIKEEIKNDTYYSNTEKIIRIRKFNTSEEIVTFKIQSLENDIEINREIEFKVDQINNFIFFLEEMNFKILYKKIKKSLIYQKGNLNIEINDIENLGFYLEIEKIIYDKNELSLAKTEIYETIKEFKLQNNIEKKSYFELILANQFKG